ncbi:YqhA family protein [Synechococcus sp. Cu2B8-bc1011]|uniref:YqhA family protein n=1 Tax=Synechococcus sp. Cu2B8-bc1011 TaxID=3093725 RepID=UPI0039AF242C|tara:strand:+ start:68 stop:625 length:558 start_codon:yes stop_codon:yes gene_type:complete
MNDQMAELEIKKSRRARFESRFEHLLWRFRLVTILPVVMSLLGSVSCFILGTQEEIHALHKLFNGYLNSEKSILLLGKVVGGIDYYVIGIALLIFGYGVYELIISDIDPRLQDLSQERRNILSITSLEGLKQKLTNVIIVALIVTAFKLMISFQVQSISELLQFCGCVLMLAFSAWLVGKNHKST